MVIKFSWSAFLAAAPRFRRLDFVSPFPAGIKVPQG